MFVKHPEDSFVQQIIISELNIQKKKWEWRGLSLNPHYEGNNLNAMIDDDRFIVHSLPNWVFGEDNTGNIMNQRNILEVWKKMEEIGFDGNKQKKVALFTADGSIDCNWSPNEQESIVANLHYCEAVCGLGALEKGGNMVLKAFTLFEHSSMNLVYLFCCLFEETIVCKPATSKSGNSEVYVVGRNFLGIEEEYLGKLLSFVSPLGVEGKALFPFERIPKSFLDQFYKCSKMFSEIQNAVIQRNLRLFKDFGGEKRIIQGEKTRIATEFSKRMRIYKIRRQDKILPEQNLDGSNNKNIFVARHQMQDKSSGSLKDRKRRREETENIYDKNEKVQKVEEITNNNQPNETELSNSVYSSTVKNMMIKMGFTEGLGLGKEGTGIKKPIDVVPREGKIGLGVGFIDRNSISLFRKDIISSIPMKQGKNEPFTEDWIVEGKKISLVTNSRFYYNRKTPEELYAFCKDEEMMKRILSQTIRYSSANLINEKTGIEEGRLVAANLDWIFGITEKAMRVGGEFSVKNVGHSSICEEIAKYFESKSPKHIKNNSEDYSIVVGDGRVESERILQPQEEELISKRVILHQALSLLENTRNGGVIIFKMACATSRFTVGIVWIIAQLCNVVQWIRPVLSSPLSSDRFLFAQGYKKSKWAISHLKKVIQRLEQLENPNESENGTRDILEIVPMPEINEDFFRFMMGSNNELDDSQLKALQFAKDQITSENSFVNDEEWIGELMGKITERFTN
eukprot:TRINITY_DN3152_c0_g1_i7.p1 TRINITY_DN3152_c0_g1~~TRINITY_DN3152_c0_g1_i7.p1  ORF type:complete len:739 (+),score=180.49 TRINITY_DN3152_c0_g1_i7:972-3188(+)